MTANNNIENVSIFASNVTQKAFMEQHTLTKFLTKVPRLMENLIQ